ncbi:hypothetical protein AJ80_03236 [Polytolypa hystricis UAMH7299]|uniref:Carboxylic ester hydrolase n=1 Tax=Polytolypa hystricis (strain UAMH7299) TaxID=1447883 RepID=A0A2B7YJG5_POLH7|nr:hypothetical protein AJ80_03236 [Polytolypa hystricis UAMH7299]
MIAPLLSLAVLAAFVSATPHNKPGHASPCQAIKPPHVPGAHIVSIKGTEKKNLTVPEAPTIPNLDICQVDVVLSHPHANDNVLVQVWLPLSQWNGRFLGTGGGAYAPGLFDLYLAPAVAQGYAAAATDGGVGVNPLTPDAWALKPNGKVNSELLENFIQRSIHDMAVVGKAVTESFYGKKPHHSYFSGCSTGGRQAMVEAQHYPRDFDGIVSGSPTLNRATFNVALLWPQVVMAEENTYPSLCEFNAFAEAGIAACDELDGLKDGIIMNIKDCNFDPYKLVGSKVTCDGKEITISRNVAKVVKRIYDGATTPSGLQLAPGMVVGTPFDSVANTTTTPDGHRVGNPLFYANEWAKYFLEKDAQFDTSRIPSSTFKKWYAQSEFEYTDIFADSVPNLTCFKDAGGKMIMWHGLADPLIYPKGSIGYRQAVEREMGGSRQVDKFYRYFLAPGAGHCGLPPFGVGAPLDPVASLVEWVERGKAPDTLPAGVVDADGVQSTHDICKYPMMSKFVGGDPKVAESFMCVRHF